MFSTHEPTWDPKLRKHTCCGSTHSYHASNCPVRNNRIPGRTSDPDLISVQECKRQGLTSGETAKKLGLPLDQVNDLWIL